MMIVVTAVSVLLTGCAVLWFSPLRPVLQRWLSRLSRYKFSSRVECLIDETKSLNQDKIFRVQMSGQILTPCDNTDTDVCVELTDITDGRFHPAPVLSVDERYRSRGHAGFHFVTYNGVIPKKNAVISSPITVVEIPCCQLRFARRGRRKLLCRVSILSRENGDVLTSDQQIFEYVSCSDGYKELQSRKMDVFKATIELAAASGGGEILFSDEIKHIFLEWLDQKAQLFPAAAQLKEWVESLKTRYETGDFGQAVEGLLAYGEPTDKLAAIELALHVAAADEEITAGQFTAIAEIAEQLDIKQSRFLELCQKILLFSTCRIEAPALLLGIDESLDHQAFLNRLTAEYRKWNARVTHPDEEIRLQADRMLCFIAELRSRRMEQTCL